MPDVRPKLLIVEDDAGLQRQLRWSYDEYQLFMAADREEAIEIFRAEKPSVVTLDLGLPPDPDGVTEGFATLADILRLAPDTKVIVASGHNARESARRAIALGAWDFYQKPIDLDSLRHIVGRAFHVQRLEAENARVATQAPADHRVLGNLVTGAAEMMEVARMVERAATADVAVLLQGASGTGKALVARALHERSGRAGGPFVTVDCGAESDLPAKVEAAAGGTLFLRAVDALSPVDQEWLQHVDARIIASTRSDDLIADGFREDLYYRIAEMAVRLPTLAERTGDAVLLARHFLKRHAAALNPQVTALSPDALEAVDAWGWPGNVRELENRIKRAVIMAEGRHVTARDLDLPQAAGGGEVVNLKAAREQADRVAIRHAMARSDGNISGAAKMLGISRPTLYDLMKSYGISA